MSIRLGKNAVSAPINGPEPKAASTTAKANQGDMSPVASANSSHANDIGATSERRRLSTIFQRLTALRP